MMLMNEDFLDFSRLTSGAEAPREDRFQIREDLDHLRAAHAFGPIWQHVIDFLDQHGVHLPQFPILGDFRGQPDHSSINGHGDHLALTLVDLPHIEQSDYLFG